jgi:hypothetical protein
MFNTNYIFELISGQLSVEGYKHFVSSISYYIRKFNWPKSIIITDEINTIKYWSEQDVKELTHQFFEWTLIKGKFEFLNKIPENYLSYYFTQILISFIANRIKEEQRKEGLSFDKCRELVISICNEDYIVNTIDGEEYVFNNTFDKEDIKNSCELSDLFSYLSKIPIKESIRQFRPLVKLAIEDIFNAIESPILYSMLIENVFYLFDQKGFISLETNTEQFSDFDLEVLSKKFDKIIRSIVSGLTHHDAIMISHFLFNNHNEQSLAEIAEFYSIPKSTLHYKIDTFKKKIILNYTPDNESDGVVFLQNLSKALDNISK